MIKDMYAVMNRIHEIRKRFGLNGGVHANRGEGTWKKYSTVLSDTLGKGNHSVNGDDEQAIKGLEGKNVEEIKKIAEHYAGKYRVSPSLVKAVIDVESGFNPGAVSPKGARGLMQLMPSVIKDYSVENPFSPRENIRAGVGLLSSLLEKYNGDYKMALSAYNAGGKAVDRSDGVPEYPETKEFIQKVITSYLKNSD